MIRMLHLLVAVILLGTFSSLVYGVLHEQVVWWHVGLAAFASLGLGVLAEYMVAGRLPYTRGRVQANPARAVFALNALCIGFLALLILVLVNLLVNRSFHRVDLTEEGVFTMDARSKELLKRLGGKLTVRYLVSEKALPQLPKYQYLIQEVTDQLNEFQNHSGGRFLYRVEDPLRGRREVGPADRDDLKKLGVVPALEEKREVEVAGKKKEVRAEREFISSLILDYADKTEVINALKSAMNLEHLLVRAIRRLLQYRIPRIGVYVAPLASRPRGRIPPQYQQQLQQQEVAERARVNELVANVRQIIRKDSIFKRIELGKGEEVDEDLDVLIVTAFREVPLEHRKKIDQYLMKGGKVVFFVKKVDEKVQSFYGRSFRTWETLDLGLEKMLSRYGVQIGTRLVYDMHRDKVFEQQAMETVNTPYGEEDQPVKIKVPWIVRSDRENHNQDLSFVNELDGVWFVRATEVRPELQRIKDRKLEWGYVISTSDRSWVADFRLLKATEKRIRAYDDKERDKHGKEGGADEYQFRFPPLDHFVYHDKVLCPRCRSGAQEESTCTQQVDLRTYALVFRDAWTQRSRRRRFSQAPGVSDYMEKEIFMSDKLLAERARQGRRFGLAMYVKGRFSSAFFADDRREIEEERKKEAKKKKRDGKGKEGEKAKEKKVYRTSIPESRKPARIVVVGDTWAFLEIIAFAAQGGGQYDFKPNIKFLTGMIQWLQSAESVDDVAPKRFRSRPLKVEAQMKGVLQVAMIAAAPLLILVFGLARVIVRVLEKGRVQAAVRSRSPENRPAAGSGVEGGKR